MVRTLDESLLFNKFLSQLITAYEFVKGRETGRVVSAIINEFHGGEIKASNRKNSFLPEEITQGRINDYKRGLSMDELAKKWGVNRYSANGWVERHRMQLK